MRRNGDENKQEGWHVIRLLRIRISDSEGDIGIGQECDIKFNLAEVKQIEPTDLEEGANAEGRYAVTVNVHQPDPDGEVFPLSSTPLEDRVPFPYYIIMATKWDTP